MTASKQFGEISTVNAALSNVQQRTMHLGAVSGGGGLLQAAIDADRQMRRLLSTRMQSVLS